MLAATVKMSDSRKKVNKNTYVHFLHKTCSQDVSGSFSLQSCKINSKKCTKKVRCTCKVAFLLIRHIVVFSPFSLPSPLKHRGGSRIFFRRGCTRLLLYFNSNKPHSFFLAEYQLYQKTAGHLRGWGGSHPLHPPPRSAPVAFRDCLSKLKSYRELCVQPWLNLCINIYIYIYSYLGEGEQPWIFRAKEANQNTQKLLSTDLVNTDYKSSNARSRSDWISFQAAFKRRIFGRPKNLTGHFVQGNRSTFSLCSNGTLSGKTS